MIKKRNLNFRPLYATGGLEKRKTLKTENATSICGGEKEPY